jgi:hypothetical protein
MTTGAKLLRPFRGYQMKKLALRLNLNYTKNKNHNWKDYFRRSKVKNIITGMYNGKKIEIYDFDSAIQCQPIYDKTIDNLLHQAYRLILFWGVPTENRTNFTFINNNVYKDFLLPYLSVNKIKKVLSNQIIVKEFTQINFNKGVFLLILITSLSITFIFDLIIFISYSTNIYIITLFSFIINVILLYINIKIAKATHYEVRIINDPRNHSNT